MALLLALLCEVQVASGGNLPLVFRKQLREERQDGLTKMEAKTISFIRHGQAMHNIPYEQVEPNDLNERASGHHPVY